MLNIPDRVRKLYISTGNILDLNEIKKKAGQDPADELVEVLKLVSERGEYLRKTEGGKEEEANLRWRCGGGDGVNYPPAQLLTSLKIFISDRHHPTDSLQQALHTVLEEVELSAQDSIILAYEGADDHLDRVVESWAVLERLAEERSVRIGLADVDTQSFIQFYNTVRVKPSIVQVNLVSCCVVPPALQQFAKDNDIQLLTHNDPSGLLSEESLKQEDGRKVSLEWAVRYQVHVKCRGVLASKGYLLSLHVD